MATPEEIEEFFSDKELDRNRTLESHQNDITSYTNTSKSVLSHGVKKTTTCFDSLKYFQLVRGLPPDVMHDYLEGTLPANFKLLMRELHTLNILKVDALNTSLKEFQYGRILKENKV